MSRDGQWVNAVRHRLGFVFFSHRPSALAQQACLCIWRQTTLNCILCCYFWCEISPLIPLHSILRWLADEILPHFLISVHPGGRITYDTFFERLLPIRYMCAYMEVAKADYCSVPALPAFYAVIIVSLNGSLWHGYSWVINIHVLIILEKQSTTNPTSIHFRLVECKGTVLCACFWICISVRGGMMHLISDWLKETCHHGLWVGVWPYLVVETVWGWKSWKMCFHHSFLNVFYDHAQNRLELIIPVRSIGNKYVWHILVNAFKTAILTDAYKSFSLVMHKKKTIAKKISTENTVLYEKTDKIYRNAKFWQTTKNEDYKYRKMHPKFWNIHHPIL